uniref:CHAT domain-containing protein n=1 Tax=Candidatus Cryptobacteroides bacterium TaxID=3085639 RepID=UPI0040279517
MSACETGLGHATPEGIYGLQRAFKKASVVNVGEASDVASSLFMTKFYKDLISDGNDIHSAFRTARAAVQKRYPDPYYWAGFLLLD